MKITIDTATLTRAELEQLLLALSSQQRAEKPPPGTGAPPLAVVSPVAHLAAHRGVHADPADAWDTDPADPAGDHPDDALVNPELDPGLHMSDVQYDLWQYLLAHDCRGGRRKQAIVRSHGITNGEASGRLLVLRNAGFARVTTRGRYRGVHARGGL